MSEPKDFQQLTTDECLLIKEYKTALQNVNGCRPLSFANWQNKNHGGDHDSYIIYLTKLLEKIEYATILRQKHYNEYIQKNERKEDPNHKKIREMLNSYVSSIKKYLFIHFQKKLNVNNTTDEQQSDEKTGENPFELLEIFDDEIVEDENVDDETETYHSQQQINHKYKSKPSINIIPYQFAPDNILNLSDIDINIATEIFMNPNADSTTSLQLFEFVQSTNPGAYTLIGALNISDKAINILVLNILIHKKVIMFGLDISLMIIFTLFRMNKKFINIFCTRLIQFTNFEDWIYKYNFLVYTLLFDDNIFESLLIYIDEKKNRVTETEFNKMLRRIIVLYSIYVETPYIIIIEHFKKILKDKDDEIIGPLTSLYLKNPELIYIKPRKIIRHLIHIEIPSEIITEYIKLRDEILKYFAEIREGKKLSN